MKLQATTKCSCEEGLGKDVSAEEEAGKERILVAWVPCNNCFMFKVLYQTTVPYDPEGILGTINTILMAFLGLQVPLFFLCVTWENLRASWKWGGNLFYLLLRLALTKSFLEQCFQTT